MDRKEIKYVPSGLDLLQVTFLSIIPIKMAPMKIQILSDHL